MTLVCKILPYVLCDVVVYGLVLILLWWAIAKKANGKKILDSFLPLSRLLMILALAVTFCWTGAPSVGCERAGAFAFALLGMLVPVVVNCGLQKEKMMVVDSSIDVACIGLFAALGFFASNMGFGNENWLIALQVALPAASAAGALSILLIKHAEQNQKKKGR